MGITDSISTSLRNLFSGGVGNTAALPDPNKTQPRVDQEPIGASGRAHFGGFIQWDELNPAWIGTAGLKLADEMWRTDADIKRDTLACWSPIMSASITVDPYGGNEATDKDHEAAELARHALWHFMSPNLIGHLNEVGPVLIRSGFVDFEQIWESTTWRGKKVVLPRKLDMRLPRTIWKWYQDDKGDLTGVVQFLPNAANVYIPATELVHYRLQAEGDNWVGTSMYRHAYRHWYFKQKLEVIDAIGQERKAVGVPFVYPPTGATEQQKIDVETVLANLHTNEVGFVVMPGPKAGPAHIDPSIGWEVAVEKFDSSSGDSIRESIDQQTLKVAGAFVADFLELGHHQVGARATADVQQDPFLTAVKAMGEIIVEPLNVLTSRIAMLNIPGLEGPPKLNISLHDEASLSELSTYALQLYQAQALIPDPRLEDYFRDRAGFPAADAEVREEVQEAKKAARQMAIEGQEAQEGAVPGGGEAGTQTDGQQVAPKDADRTNSPGQPGSKAQTQGPGKPKESDLKEMEGLSGGADGLQIVAPLTCEQKGCGSYGKEVGAGHVHSNGKKMLDAVPPPPNYRPVPMGSAKRCGTCKMDQCSHCWGYGDVLIDELGHVCDSWAASKTPIDRLLEEPTAKWWEELLSQGKLKEALDNVRQEMEKATRPAAIKLAATMALRGRKGRKIAVATPPDDLVEAFTKEMERLYDIGFQTVQDELAQQHIAMRMKALATPAQTPQSAAKRRTKVRKRAKIAAEHVNHEVAREVEKGALNEEEQPLVIQRRAETAATKAIHNEALRSASAVLNEGRADAAAVAVAALALRGEEEGGTAKGPSGEPLELRGLRSSALDERVCDHCLEADDGTERLPDDPVLIVPDPLCAGQEFCRCVVLWSLTGAREALTEAS